MVAAVEGEVVVARVPGLPRVPGQAVREEAEGAAREAREITECYVEARYGNGLSKPESRELLARVRSFRPA